MEVDQILALTIFCLTYLGMAFGHFYYFKLDRTGIALLGAIAILATGVLSLDSAIKSVNMRSMLMLFSLMVISSQLQRAGFYLVVARWIAGFLHRPAFFLAFLMFSSGLLSAFLNNDIVCFAFTPVVALALVEKKINPIPFLIGLAVSSNIGCAATMIGNAQNVLIGELAHLDFASYIRWTSVPVICSLIAAYFVIILITGGKFNLSKEDYDADFEKEPGPKVTIDTWQICKGLFVVFLLIAFFFTSLPRYVVALVGAGALLTSHRFKSRKILKLVDWQLIILFIGLFVVIGGFDQSGLGEKTITFLRKQGVNLQNFYTLGIITAALSNLINNSATVMLLAHFLNFDNPVTAYVLALSNTFAGNIFIIGSVANIIVVNEAKRCGIPISFAKFAKFGIPIGLTSIGILLAWIKLSC
ncbi:MAG: SLC13 family permease [Candidatus Nanoarchaeia archaeon]